MCVQAAFSLWRLNSPYSIDHFSNLPVPRLQQFLRERGQVMQLLLLPRAAMTAVWWHWLIVFFVFAAGCAWFILQMRISFYSFPPSVLSPHTPGSHRNIPKKVRLQPLHFPSPAVVNQHAPALVVAHVSQSRHHSLNNAHTFGISYLSATAHVFSKANSRAPHSMRSTCPQSTPRPIAMIGIATSVGRSII